MVRRPRRLGGVRAGARVAAPVSCSASAVGSAGASGAASATVPSTVAEVPGDPVPGLPGDEALTPPPPDSAAADHLARLADVPTGALTGHLTMTVSGLAAFDEDVTGTCSRTDGLPVFRATLSDGSTWEVAFGEDGATSSLEAPGVRVDQQLRETDVSVSEQVVVGASLLTTGTSEPSGSVEVEFTCT